MKTKNELIQSKFGYLSLKDMPTVLELEKYYADKYFQQDKGNYFHKYTKDEYCFFKNSAKVSEYIYTQLFVSNDKKLLDVGAGEGFFSNYFFKNNWNITTLDYSDEGMKKHNPLLLNTLTKGDIFAALDVLVDNKSTFNIINMSNVLEHVLDPISILNKFKLLLDKKSLLRISVPNDYSHFQSYLMDRGYTTNTWLCPPDHLHYFTFESLSNLLISLNYEIVIQMGEFPIELFLSNELSNYVKNKANGKHAHKSRVEVDNFLFDQGIEKYINYYKASADIGFSRQVIIYAKVKG